MTLHDDDDGAGDFICRTEREYYSLVCVLKKARVCAEKSICLARQQVNSYLVRTTIQGVINTCYLVRKCVRYPWGLGTELM